MIVARSREIAAKGAKEYSPGVSARGRSKSRSEPRKGGTVSYRYVSTLGGINSDFSSMLSKLSTIPPQNADQKLRM